MSVQYQESVSRGLNQSKAEGVGISVCRAHCGSGGELVLLICESLFSIFFPYVFYSLFVLLYILSVFSLFSILYSLYSEFHLFLLLFVIPYYLVVICNKDHPNIL